MKSRIQIAIFDVEGFLRESCNSLFDLLPSQSVYDQSTYLHGLAEVFPTMQIGHVHDFKEVVWDEEGSLMNFHFERMEDGLIKMVAERSSAVSTGELAEDVPTQMAELQLELISLKQKESTQVELAQGIISTIEDLNSSVSLMQTEPERAEDHFSVVKLATEQLNAAVSDMFDLPVQQKTDAEGLTFENQSESSEVMPLVNLKGHAVLLANEASESRNLVQSFLEQSGAKVTMATDGFEALEFLTDKEPALVISDLELPEISGIQLLKRQRKQNSQIPFIFVSGHTAESQNGLKHYENWQCLQKPLDLKALSNSISNVLAMNENYKVDLSTLKKIVGGDEGFLKELIVTISDTLPGEMTLLTKAVENEQWEPARQVLHKIRPSIDYLGVASLIEQRNELHELVHSGENKALIISLHQEFDQGVALALADMQQYV